MNPVVDPFNPWNTLTMWQRIERLVHDPRTHLEKGKIYPIVHCWTCGELEFATSWTVFREYGHGSDTEPKPYRAKYIDWDGRTFAHTDRLVLLEDPELKIIEGVINAARFKAMYEKATTITIPLLVEGMAPNAAIRDAGCRIYPRVEMRFGHSEIPVLTEAFMWAFELQRFIEQQLGVK